MSSTDSPAPAVSVPQRLCSRTDLLPVAVKLLWQAGQADDVGPYLLGVLPDMAEVAGSDYAAVAVAAEGRWAIEGESRGRRPLPVELLGEVLDRESPLTKDDWVAAPLGDRNIASEVLVLHRSDSAKSDDMLSIAEDLAPVLSEALATVRQARHRRRQIRRLEAILEIANQWNQTQEVEPLLTQMAEAATRLLESDRASIFVWDRKNHILVGRPALGIEEGELRIPDDRGVVGQVIQTGQPRRVDATLEPDQIDRQVDTQLQYETKNLLCVPLRGRKGELFGAFEILNKRSGSFSDEDEAALVELASHAAVALENAQDRQQLLSTNRQITQQAAQRVQLIGQSPAIEALRSIIHRVADTDLAVLILGENGTGKEVVSQSVHYLSRRSGQPFIAVNCAAIPETLAESELFGHEKGAFTDAREARAGKFELATGGTLFLDEIGDLSLACQAKLLRVLEEKVLVRVGGSVPIHTDSRVLAATNQNLAEMVREKRFREDLYFRLNVVTLELPPLRDRAGDVVLLAEHFLRGFCIKARRKMPQLTEAARKRLIEHPWPGNVRELRNLMERLAYLASGETIEAEDLAFILSPKGQVPMSGDFGLPLGEATIRFQAEYILQAIERAEGNVSRAAESLGLHRSNLYRKMRQLGMEPPR